MSLFKKVIASVGVGSAKVDTRLKNTYIKQGEHLEGLIEIKGGSTEQKIESIHVNLMTLFGQEGSDRLTSTIVHSHQVSLPLIISEGEAKSIGFSFTVPLDTPITMVDPETQRNVPPVWIETELNVKNAIDPKDKDFISVEPTDVHEQIVDAIKIIGFQFRQMENQKTPVFVKTKRPYVQQFEFIPSFGKYLNKLDELEVYILQDTEETTIHFEIDKKSKGAAGAIIEKLNLDEHRGHVTLNNEEILKNRSKVSDLFEELIASVL